MALIKVWVAFLLFVVSFVFAMWASATCDGSVNGIVSMLKWIGLTVLWFAFWVRWARGFYQWR